MSYILDALTKAAQQRDRQVPVVQRLLSPAPRPRSSWHYASGRLLAALALNAVLLSAVLFWWLRPAAVTAPEPIAAAPESIATPAPPVTSPRPLVKLEPLPSAETKVEKPAPPRLAPSTPAVPPAATPPAAPPVAVAPAPAPSAPPRPRSGTPTIQATPAPAPAPRPPASPETASLRLEALIYADAPAERMVFINGRRYREGDSIDGRLRIEEIREEGVELSDQGRRFTLRVAR
jgi:general secretion pathway protein B